MSSSEQEIRELREEIRRVEQRFNSNLEYLKNRLGSLEALEGARIEPSQEPSQEPSPIAVVEQTMTQQALAANPDPWTAANKQHSDVTESKELQRSGLWSTVKELLTTIVISRLGPISELIHLILETFEHYKREGKTATFLMTVFGILALVLGFGYLLQYTFVNVFGDGVKILSALLIASGVFGAGSYLYVKKKDYLEFASAILATSIVLYYLCIFFAAFYYTVIPPELAIFLFGIVTLLGLGASLFFVTRVVAVITIVGGSFTPFLIGDAEVGSLHLIMQLMLSACVIGLAIKIRWDRLIHLGFIATLVVTQIYLYSNQHLPLMGWHLVLFFYLFCVPLMGPWKSSFEATDIQVLMFNLAFFVIAPWQHPLMGTGIHYYVGAVLFTALFLLYRRLPTAKDLQALVVLFVAVLLAAGIFIQVNSELYGLLWGIEGLLLVAVGSRFDNRLIRWEGFVALIVGILAVIYNLAIWFLTIRTGANPWLLLLSPGFVLIAVQAINLYYSRDQSALDRNSTEMSAVRFFREGISVWICLATMTGTYFFLPSFVFVVAFPASVLVLLICTRTQSVFSHWVALVNLSIIPIGVVVGMIDSGSFLVRNLPLYAKICLAELALLAWGLQWFYERRSLPFYKIQFSVLCRQAFYLILPLALLPRIWRSYEDWFAIAILASAGFSTLLYRVFGSRPLMIEARVLIVLASAYSINAIILGIPHEYAIIDAVEILFAGFVLLAGITYLNGGLGQYFELDKPYATAKVALLHYFAAAMFLVCFQLTKGLALPCLVVALTYVSYVFLVPRLATLRVHLQLHHVLAWVFCSFGLLNLLFAQQSLNQIVGFSLQTVTMAGLIALFYGNSVSARLLRNRPIRVREKFVILHVMVFGTYVAAEDMLFDVQLGAFTTLCMVIHATMILFQVDSAPWKNSVQLSKILYVAVLLKVFLVDMENFSVFEKMLAFIGMGCVLLISAYQYQKRQKATVEASIQN